MFVRPWTSRSSLFGEALYISLDPRLGGRTGQNVDACVDFLAFRFCGWGFRGLGFRRSHSEGLG